MPEYVGYAKPKMKKQLPVKGKKPSPSKMPTKKGKK